MCDPVVFRCNDQHHWRTGDKYKVCNATPCVGLAAVLSSPSLDVLAFFLRVWLMRLKVPQQGTTWCSALALYWNSHLTSPPIFYTMYL